MLMTGTPSKVSLNNRVKIHVFLKQMKRWKVTMITKEWLTWLNHLMMKRPTVGLQHPLKARPMLRKIGALQ